MIGIIAFILLLPFSAYAFEYREDGMAIDVPDGSNIYYYTATGTNMTGEMLDAAQEEAPLVLTGAYSEDGILLYSLKITREEAEPAQENGTGAAREKAAAVKETLAEEYAFSEDTEETAAGRQSVVLSGDSLKNPDYAVKLYVLEDGGKVYTATVIYRKSAGGQHLNAAI